jgi:transcriptional regulator with XRE-family HTH domain
MTPEQIKQTRHQLGLTLTQLGELMGYQGVNVRVQMDDLETGRRPLRECQRRLLTAYRDGYRPRDWPIER